MIELNGKYNNAKVFTDNIEQEAISQIIGICNHPAFQNAQIRVMPDCLTDDTEILTSLGFKYIKDLKKSDLIANVLDNGKVFFSNPLNIISRELRQDEKVYEITDNRYGYTMKSTENHRNAYKKYKGVKTKDLPNNLVVSDFIWNGRGLEVQEDYCISDVYLQLLAWILGDGNIKVTHNKNSDNYRIRFGFKKERKIKRVLDLLCVANLKYTLEVTEKQTTIYLNTESSKWFVNFLGTEKKIPLDLAIKLSKRQAKLFLEEAIQVDGDYESYIKRRGIRYNSKNISFIEFISILFTLNFGTAKINIRTNMKSFKENTNMYYINCVLEERLQYSKSGLHNTKLIKQEIKYTGKVVCVTCDTGFFIARQNGRTFVTGNCHAGAGCTIGTTIKLSEKKIVPNLVGVDIGCGVSTTVFKSEVPLDFAKVDAFIRKEIPSGMTVRAGKHKNLKNEVKDVIKEVVEELNLRDLNYHLNSVGTLGGGNHYIEIGQIDETTFALSIHTGSRNLGKKVCEHFQLRAVSNLAGGKRLQEAQAELIAKLKREHREKDINKSVINLKNNFEGKITGIPKELAYIEAEDFDAYIVNMIKCQRMAAESRRLMSYDIVNMLGVEVTEQFDTIHNYIEQSSDGFITIRKGAISAKAGEKLAIPLNMRDGVIIGVGKGNEDWNYSAPHGAGRLMSRSKAKYNVTLEEFEDSMKGIFTTSVGIGTIDESPMAYKPMQEIVDNIQDTVDIIAIIKPLYNFKASEEPKAWEK